VLDEEQEPVAPEEVLGFVFGMGQLLPELEARLECCLSGDRVEVVVPCERAFGRRRDERVVEIDRSELPAGAAEGDCFELENNSGDTLLLKVLEVGEDFVVADLNHPLADQDVTYRLEVREVRPATTEELEAAALELEEGVPEAFPLIAHPGPLPGEGGSPGGALPEGGVPLVPVSRLLRGGAP